MTTFRLSRRSAGRTTVTCLILGTVCFGLGAFSFVLSRNFFDPAAFGRRAGESLSDPGVASYAANLVTSGIIRGKPDLIAYRPVLLSTTEALVSSKVFRSFVERGAMRAHQAVFSEGSRRVLLSLPDLDVLVHEGLSHVSPAIAAKVPKSLDTTVAELANSRNAAILLNLARAGKWLRRAWPVFFALALGLYIVALWLAPSRGRGMARAGIGLIVTGLVLAGIVAANPLAGILIHDERTLGLVRGLWRTYLGDLSRWGLFFAGLGVLVAAGASSLLERVDAVEKLNLLVRALATPPVRRARRFLWGLGLFLTGCLIFLFPALLLSCTAVLIGVLLAYAGSRELFRIFLETLGHGLPDVSDEVYHHRGRAVVAIVVVVIALGGAWFVWHNPAQAPAAATTLQACNGFPELCDRPIDQVVFAGAHNAMSNQDAPGWMFPHHETGMPTMLQEGIRALLIDVHYGFAGGARIKTDMSAEPSAAKIKEAVGEESYAAAMRIRDRLNGVNESQHAPYFCHGFCELGAYPVAPALREIRDFVATRPDEVLILVIEDYVTPQDLAAEFDKAGLAEFVYKDNPGPPWPTLRQIIQSGKRVLVFIESGKPGVPWIRPAFETFRETPYSFHKVEDFTCRPNRGGDAGSLFQINHWIDTTPTPKPSNAAIVNASAFLMARAQQCAAERKHLPNLIAVDFYRTGDLIAVVNKLNGVGE